LDRQIIDINFFPLKVQDFEFGIYAQKCSSNDQRCDEFDFEIKRFKLQLDSDVEYNLYFVSFEQHDNFTEYSIMSNHNNNLTLWYIYNQLYKNAINQSIEIVFKKKYGKYIDVIYKKLDGGNEAISITPKYLHNKFGFIINFHFKKSPDKQFNKEIQIASLSLNKSGSPNNNYYSDMYNKIIEFLNSNKSVLLNINNLNNINYNSMFQIESNRLGVKKYVFGNGNNDTSQFKGILNFGPYQPYANNPIICFVFRPNEKTLSHTLYHALNGKTYPTFKGMEKMFNFVMDSNNVIGIPIVDFSPEEINKLIIEMRQRAQDRPVIPIFIVPWVRESAKPEESKIYYNIKHQLIKEKIASQFVGISRINNYDNLKWSVASIGLQIFTKLGGSPWCMEVTKNKCLIIGIGQSHKKDIYNKIEKYYSYSIMTDSSGVFKNIKILSANIDKNEYLNGLVINLKNLILNEINQYNNVVIHTSFKLRNIEIKKINEVIAELSKETKKQFMVIRFSDKHDYIGFNLSSNAKTPYESSVLKINNNEYLIWFEGASSSKPNITTRISPPLHLTIDYPKEANYIETKENLQDALNLSGANWRGFNAKTTPVSILYAHLLSSFLAKFEEYNLEEININELTPWFI